MLTIKKESTKRGGRIFNPSGMNEDQFEEAKKKNSVFGNVTLEDMQNMFDRAQIKRKGSGSRKFKKGGLVSGKAQAKKYFKGIF
tara:strand:+ start:97 stop:348 length:252 start_codon:yes stop_codon:yes gene_type:complete